MPHPLSAALRAYAQPEYRLPAGAAANLESAAEALDASAGRCEPAQPITGLPDLGHDWKPVRVDDGLLLYECRCLAPRSPVPHRDSFCPDAVLDYANRLVAEERAKTRALLEGLRDQMLGHAAAAADQCNHFDDGRCDAHRADADLLTEALTTLTGSDR